MDGEVSVDRVNDDASDVESDEVVEKSMLIEKKIVKPVLLAILAFASMAGGGLIAQFKFDGHLFDTSGNGYLAGDGQLIGDTHYVEGKSGMALDFDGDGDFIRAMVAPDGSGGWMPQTIDDQTAMTVAMWIKMDAEQVPSPDGVDLLACRSWDGNGDVNLEFHTYFGMDQVFLINVEGFVPAENPLGTITPAMLGEWVHIVATYDSIAGQAYIYINGVAGVAVTIPAGRTVDIGNYSIGGSAYLKARYFDGQIDEVRIYDYALDPEEVQVLFHEFGEVSDQCGFFEYLPGDLNLDCHVNLQDLAELASDWLKCTKPEDFTCHAP